MSADNDVASDAATAPPCTGRLEFQRLTGSASGGERSLVIASGSLLGENVRFELQERRAGEERRFVLTGQLEDGRLSGSVQGPDEWGRRSWRAARFGDASRPPN